jgi:hypothetical protein
LQAPQVPSSYITFIINWLEAGYLQAVLPGKTNCPHVPGYANGQTFKQAAVSGLKAACFW